MVLGVSGLFLVILGVFFCGFRWSLAVLGDYWWFLVVFGGSWWFLIVLVVLVVLGGAL